MRGTRGLNQPLDGMPECDVVALICASKFPAPLKIREVVEAAPDGVIFLVRDRDTVARAVLDSVKREYVALPLNPYWKGEWGDRRAEVREEEILRLSRRILVFATPGSNSLDTFIKADPLLWGDKVRIIWGGQPPAKKHRKGRKIE